MSLYNIGNFIRRKREELGITQEELSEGICSVTTLSRLENGEQTPRSNNVRALLQRLGYSDAMLFQAARQEEFEIVQLQVKFKRACYLKKFDEAQKLLDSLGKYQDYFSLTDHQYYQIATAIMKDNASAPDEILKMFEDALRLTHPKYKRSNLPKALTYEEVLALNNIAIVLDTKGDRSTAIEIFYHLKSFYDQKVVDIEEVKKMYPTIIYNLSKALGLASRFDECIECCSEGIRFAKEAHQYANMPETLYNLAWALVKRGRPCDTESAKRAAKEAYLLSEIFQHRPGFSERMRKFIKDNFDEEPPKI